jgi:hypothetical protein
MSDETKPQDSAAMPPASAGSQPVAYEINWKGQDGKYLAKPYLVFANEQPSEHWTPAPRCVPLYRSPTLTDEEREAIELAAGDYIYHQDPGGRAQHIRATLLGLLERLK